MMMRKGRLFTAGLIPVPALVFIIGSLFLAACGPSAVPADTGQSGQRDETQVTEWFYDHFDEERRNAYDAFRRSVTDPFCTELTAITGKDGEAAEIAAGELDSVYQGFLYDHPELFWLDRTYRFRISGAGGTKTADAVGVIPLPGSEEEIEQYTERFTDAAGILLKQLGTLSGKREAAGKIYDLLAGHADYTEEALYDTTLVNEHTAYGAIVEKSAVCDGYALALKYLMDRSGIECVVIPGTVNGASHVWNTVFWDGAWHEMDITWDASDRKGRQYFDLTTEEMERDHRREPAGIGTMIPVSKERDEAGFPAGSAL